MTPFSEPLRYDYPELGKNSVVVDVGAYHGNWAKAINAKYGCIVLAFEAVKAFFEIASAACADTPRINLFNCGLGSHFRSEMFGVQNDSTGAFAGSEVKEKVIILPIVDHLRQVYAAGKFSLIKINAEGMEYEIMESLIQHDALGLFQNYQIQFHTCAPDYQKRYDSIAAALSATHELTWREPFVWENWRKK